MEILKRTEAGSNESASNLAIVRLSNPNVEFPYKGLLRFRKFQCLMIMRFQTMSDTETEEIYIINQERYQRENH